jgi:hypothetical protein
MYKKQMRFQKFACLLAIIAAAVAFLYSLGMITDIYDSLYATMMNPNDLTQTSVPGSIIYYDMQSFNKEFTTVTIGLILLACLLFLTNTNVRRKYYIGNYVSTVLYSVATLATAVWAHVEISAFKVQYLTTVDFDALKAFAEQWGKTYIESTFCLDMHYVVLVLAVLSVAALVFNLIWKIRLMNAEAALVRGGEMPTETGDEAVLQGSKEAVA